MRPQEFSARDEYDPGDVDTADRDAMLRSVLDDKIQAYLMGCIAALIPYNNKVSNLVRNAVGMAWVSTGYAQKFRDICCVGDSLREDLADEWNADNIPAHAVNNILKELGVNGGVKELAKSQDFNMALQAAFESLSALKPRMSSSGVHAIDGITNGVRRGTIKP